MTDQERIAHYRAEAEAARDTVRDIVERGWRFQASEGTGEMRDVTEERRAEREAYAKMMDEIADAWGRRS